MNTKRDKSRPFCWLMVMAVLMLIVVPVAAQDEMMADDMSMDDDMMMEAMSMDDDMMMEDDMMMPPPRTCLHLVSHVAVYSNQYGLNCKDVGAAGIGVQSVVDAGVVSAIDIWHPMGVDAEVCFSIAGPLTLLDASTAPRTVSTPESYTRDNLTCTHLTGPGTVVLHDQPVDDMMMDDMMMEDDMMADDDMMMDDMAVGDVMTLDEATMDDDMMMDDDMAMEDDMMMEDEMMADDDMMEADPLLIADSMETMVYLEGCTVTAMYSLNLRAEPAGEILGIVAGGASLEPSARTPNWFKVDYNDVEGWITAHYIEGEGECG